MRVTGPPGAFAPARLVLLALAMLVAGQSAADVPDRIPFSALLRDANRLPVTGPVMLTLGIFDQPVGGTLLYEEIHVGVRPRAGFFAVDLGDGIPTAAGASPSLDGEVLGAPERWIAVTVNGELLEPRAPFTAAAHALAARHALDADQLAGVPAAAFQRRVAQGCPEGSAIRAIAPDGSVTCAPDQSGSRTAGDGLLLAGDTFQVDFAAVQRRVTGTCAAGTFVRAVNADGSVDCAPDRDEDTVYSAGEGLTLTGTTFAVDADIVQRRVAQRCGAGEAVRAVAASGGVTCEPLNGGDVAGVTGGPGIDADGCNGGPCTLVLDTSESQARMESCPPGTGVAAVAASGTPTCVPLFDGQLEALTTSASSGLSGGCASGTCNLAVDSAEIQRRITGCNAGAAIRSVAESGAASCIAVVNGDIQRVRTDTGSGLTGGCVSGACSLSLVPSAFLVTRLSEHDDLLGRRITETLPNGQSVFTFTRGLVAPAAGTVLAIASAHVKCGAGCNGVASGFMLLTTDADANLMLDTETRFVEAGTNDWTSVAAQRLFPVADGEQILVYWRAASLAPGATNLTVHGARMTLLFIP